MANDAITSITPKGPRRPLLTGFFSLLAIAAIAATAHYWFVSRFLEETDDAYVSANVIMVTPQVTGIVRAVNVRDTDHVKAGHTLVELDDADARIALESAEAELARAVREIRTVFANNDTLSADAAVRRADLEQARALASKAEDDYATRKRLVVSGAVGKEELKHADAALAAARSAVEAARSAVSAAEERLASNRALTEGTSVENHPAVASAASKVREAWLAVARCTIKAPMDGDIVKRTVHVGQRVQPGMNLMSVVTLDRMWVDANFKEVQLREMRLGQPVKLRADVYGKTVEYDGKVAGFGAGTGAVFSLLPAQNATGNWIKIVQRVPVRIDLVKEQILANPLRVGLSMVVKVDLRDGSGQALAQAPAGDHIHTTDIFEGQREAAEARVAEIIAANRGTARKG